MLDITVDCLEIPPAAPVSSINASDNCDNDVEITFSEWIVPGPCIVSYTIVREYTATDNCGNQTTDSYEVEVVDDVEPILSGVPSDITVECDEIPQPPMVGVDIIATDNCDAAPSIFLTEFVLSGPCEDSYTIIREWLAMDNCGNTESQSQQITVLDNTAPIISNVPADLTVDL